MPMFFDMHAQKNILCEWYSYLEIVILDKLKICMHEKIDIMIDDKPENLLALKDKIKVICYPAIWNEKVDDENIIRVSGWKDVYKKIGEIEEGS